MSVEDRVLTLETAVATRARLMAKADAREAAQDDRLDRVTKSDAEQFSLNYGKTL